MQQARRACVSCGREAVGACGACEGAWRYCSAKCREDVAPLHAEVCFDPTNWDAAYVSRHLRAALEDVLDGTNMDRGALFEKEDVEEMRHLLGRLDSPSAIESARGWIGEIVGSDDTARVMRAENFTLEDMRDMIEYGLEEDRAFLARLAHDPLCPDDEVDALHTHLGRREDTLNNIVDAYRGGVRYRDLGPLHRAQIAHLIARVASKATKRRARRRRRKKAKGRRKKEKRSAKKEKKHTEKAEEAEAERDDTSRLRVFKRRKLKKKAQKHRGEAERQRAKKERRGRKAAKTEAKLKKTGGASASASSKQRIRTRMGVLRYVHGTALSPNGPANGPVDARAPSLYRELLQIAAEHPTNERVAGYIQSYAGGAAWCREVAVFVAKRRAGEGK